LDTTDTDEMRGLVPEDVIVVAVDEDKFVRKMDK
jgi:hypothetical protein